jgi:hypothetical protein
MTYLDTFDLTQNREYQARITAAASEQALIFVDDARPEFVAPAHAIILSAGAASAFFSLVAAQPAITAESTDGDLLAALQAVWPKYGAALVEDEPLVEDA